MNMLKFWDILGRAGRTCLHCGSSQVSASLFCNSCEIKLFLRHHGGAFESAEHRLWVFSLFIWRPDQDRAVSKLMLTLKEGKPQAAWDHYARIFYLKNPEIEIPRNAVLVPCASTDKRRHALVFASSLGALFGLPVLDVLKWEQITGSQKRKSLKMRKAVEFTATKAAEDFHVIFIDDIITTGGTALAARKALVGCVGFEAWCLARRDFAEEQF